MKKILVSLVFAIVGVFAFAVPAFASCTPTGFIRDGINMTAYLINPGSVVSGDVDATGCNIGVYFDQNGVVNSANIFGSNYFGVLVNGDIYNVTVDIADSSIHDIGENPLNGSQHGVAVYYRALATGTTTGTIVNNQIYKYQKGGIVANGQTDVSIVKNNVTGEGHVDYIAQNGIQVGYGATGRINDNEVTGNSYAKPGGGDGSASAGILIIGGPYYGYGYSFANISNNDLGNNDVGIWLVNLTAAGLSPEGSEKTNNKVVNNRVTNDGLFNQSTYISGKVGYQVGIEDWGNGDKIINNKISGNGYNPLAYPGAFVLGIYIDPTTEANVHANKFQ